MSVVNSAIITEVSLMGAGGTACAYAFNAINDAIADGASTVDTGTLFSNATTIGFFGRPPTTLAAQINTPVGGATEDAEARAAIASILALLAGYGLMNE